MKLKKVLASVMAAAMVMSSTVNAFAADPIPTVPEGETTPTEEVVIEEPVVDEPEVDPVKDLFDKLMAFETYEALDAYMTDEMTEEDYVLLGQFSDEQNAALSARVAELQENEIDILKDRYVRVNWDGVSSDAVESITVTYRNQSHTFEYGNTDSVKFELDNWDDEHDLVLSIKYKSDSPSETYTASVNSNFGTYTVSFRKVNNGSQGGNNNGGYQLSQSYYKGSAKVLWDVMDGKAPGVSSRVTSVTLDSKAVKWATSNVNWVYGPAPAGWDDCSPLSTYYGNITSNSQAVDKTLRITPAEGYYVTEVVVGCCYPGPQFLGRPYNCNTWSDGNTFTRTFTLTSDEYIEFDLPSNAFGHASSANYYCILIQVAPRPNPLYVEYDCGEMAGKADIFAEPALWTNESAGNVLGTGEVETDYTQFKYLYNEQAEIAKWKHYANTVTDAAKDAAKAAGYTFAGWEATYYNECEVSKPEARANNLIYNFDDQYSDGSTPYAEGDQVALTTHVKLVAQWEEIKTTTATVVKVWDDSNDKDGMRPDSLTVTLSNGKTVTLSEANQWTATEKDLPLYDAAGKEIVYSWTEGEVANYTLTNTSKEGTVTTLTNTHTPETVDLTVKKVWSDNNNENGNRPASLTVTLSNGTATVETVILTADNQWTETVTGLPKYADGEEIVYTWTEGAMPEGYELTNTSVNGTITTLTNSYTLPRTSATVKKVWDDANNQDGKRPASLEVTLSDGTKTVETVTLNKDNEWTATVNDLPKYKDGKEIVYTWTEGDMPEGYTLTNTAKEGTITTLTNSYTPEKTEATVKKVWNDADNQDGKRPTELKVTLSNNGTEVTLNEANGWTETVTGLPKYAAGVEIVYTWTEGEMPEGYALTNTAKEGTITTLTNSYTPEKTEATVKKVWEDANNQDGKRPTSLTVTLSNGTDTVETVTLNEGNQWTAKVEKLPKYANGQLITYTWTEEAVTGYTLTNTSKEGTVTTLTNSYTPETVDLVVTKQWNDMNNQDGIRPESLIVTLNNGTTVTLNEENKWTSTVTGLPKYNNGQVITYTWTEEAVTGYTLTSSTLNNETILINTHVPENTEATVIKVWDDAEDQDGKRPESLTVTLSNDTEVTLNEANGWTATVKDLPKYANGQEIKYTWTEATVDGYELTDTSKEGTVTTLTNTHTPETTSVTVNKVWDDQVYDDLRPESITINLLADGTKIDSKTVSEADKWTHTFTDLPKYEDGVKIVYTITEDDVNGYSSSIAGSAENGFTVTNTINKFILNVNKKWIGRTGGEVEVQILRNTEVLDTVKLNANNEWKAETTIYGSMEAINVKEVKVPSNYHVSYSNISSADENGQYNVTVTNTYIEEDPEIPDEPGKKFVVKKIWVDDHEAVRPESIKVQLYKNGKAYGRAVTLSADNNWRYVWTDLPDSDKINWTVKETVVPVGYTASIEEVRSNHHYIINTYKPVKENAHTGA